MKPTKYLAVAAAAVAVSAGVVSAAPLPVASLSSTGAVSFTASSGLSGSGDLVAVYRQPAAGKVPYVFSKKLSFSDIVVTPNITLTTPSVELTPETVIPGGCLPFIGCFPDTVIPGLTAPSFDFTVDVPVTVLPATTLFDKAFVSRALPVGDVLGFDFGSILLGEPLSFGSLLQDQFETGATTVNKAGAVGPFDLLFDYEGVLSGDTINADFLFGAAGPGLLGELESLVIGLVNDNASLFIDVAIAAVQGSDLCEGSIVSQVCDLLPSLAGEGGVSLTVNSIANFSGEFHLDKTIAPIPVPFALPLLATGFGLMGMLRLRRRSVAA